MLVRAKELATQYQNGTYSSADKTAIESELQTLDDEIQNILDNTKFNGITMDQTVDIQIDDNTSKVTITATNLTIDVATVTSPDDVDDLIKDVNEARSTYGSLQNRLEHTSNNLGNTVENLTSAESRIRDTDMAKEMMEFTKKNILTQASQAMLAQANQTPQSVLSLLR
jgi:flagellin